MADLLTSLESKFRRWSTEADTEDTRAAYAHCASEVRAHHAELAEALRDAQRYRWLRDNGSIGLWHILFDRREPEEWNAEIDALAAIGQAEGKK